MEKNHLGCKLFHMPSYIDKITSKSLFQTLSLLKSPFSEKPSAMLELWGLNGLLDHCSMKTMSPNLSVLVVLIGVAI